MEPTDAHDEREGPPSGRFSDQANEPPTVKTPVQARAGLIGGHVITILIIGTVLAIVLLAVVFILQG